jgi:hypothetical protein
LNWYTYCYNNPLIHIDPDGQKAYGISLGASGYIFVGGRVSASIVWDEYRNYGILVTGGVGFGAEVELNVTKSLFELMTSGGLGISFNDADTIYDLRGYDGMEISASFILSATIDEEGNFSGISGPGIGGSISWGHSFLIPVSDGVDFVKDLLHKYSEWLRENNVRWDIKESEQALDYIYISDILKRYYSPSFNEIDIDNMMIPKSTEEQ